MEIFEDFGGEVWRFLRILSFENFERFECMSVQHSGTATTILVCYIMDNGLMMVYDYILTNDYIKTI